MFSTSLDVLHLVLSLCIAVLTFFLCWSLYYFIASMRKAHRIIKRIEAGVVKAEELVDLAKNKLKNSGAYFMILGELAKKAMEFIKDKREKKKTGKTK